MITETGRSKFNLTSLNLLGGQTTTQSTGIQTTSSIFTIPSTSSCSTGSICGQQTSEPITEAIGQLREKSVCTLANDVVDAIAPNLASNPQNVKNVEAEI